MNVTALAQLAHAVADFAADGHPVPTERPRPVLVAAPTQRAYEDWCRDNEVNPRTGARRLYRDEHLRGIFGREVVVVHDYEFHPEFIACLRHRAAVGAITIR